MLPEIVILKKDFTRRLAEYNFLRDQVISCGKVYKLWGEVLDYTFGHVKNWSALWQLSEENCIRFKALYPMVVVVSVRELLEEDLSAAVTVEGTQEDISFPGIIEVPIFELFPLKQQTLPLGTVTRIADTIDQCRFFFLNLWYPWDNLDDLSVSEWCERHLESRLKLQCELTDGALDQITTQHVKNLMTEALQVADALEGIEEEMPMTRDNKLNVVKNLFRKEEIKLQLSLYEDQELRETMMQLLCEKETLQNNTVGIVIYKGALKDVSNNLKMVHWHVKEDEKVAIYSDVQQAVDSCQSVLLTPGRYKLANLGCLAFGGTLKGVGHAEETIITPIDVSPARYTFLSSFKCVLFENITVERSEGVLFSVTDRVMRLHNCVLRGLDGQLACGIVVMPGCRVELVDCDLSRLETALIIRNGATALVHSCRIHKCAQGIKIMDNSTATLEKVDVTSCTTAGIVVQSSKNGEDVSGAINVVSDSSPRNWFVSFSECTFNDNKVDALVVRMPVECLSD